MAVVFYLVMLYCVAVFIIHSGVVFGVTTATRRHLVKKTASNGIGTPCGDNWCTCKGSLADCSNHQSTGGLTYIPSLPANISELDFTVNALKPGQVNDKFFTNATHITVLRLAYNELTFTPPPDDVFQPVRNLTDLYLDGNRYLSLTWIVEALTAPTIRTVSANGCEIPDINKIKSLSNLSHVKKLDLTDNALREMNLNSFIRLEQLTYLYLGSNKITRLTGRLGRLTELSLGYNHLSEFPWTCDDHFPDSLFPALEFLDLMNNHIHYVENAVCLPRLQYLDLSENNLQVIPESAFRDFTFPGLRILYLGRQNGFSLALEKDCFNSSQLERLYLTNSGIRFGDPTRVPLRSFANCPKLSELYLDSNTFRDVGDERFHGLFAHLPLVVLSMRNVQLDDITTSTFSPFQRLEKLVLNENKITRIPDGAFDHCLRLKELDLSYNKIFVIAENSFNEMLRSQLSHLLLNNNPFLCSCDLLWFQSWFLRNHSLFFQWSDTARYRCNNIAQTRVEDFSIAPQACMLSQETSVQISVICCVLIVTLTSFTLAFRYRWHVRLLLYEAFRGRGDLRRQRLYNNIFDYDVFVSYASQDLPWVRQHLVPELEDLYGMRLCIHERDFIPGKNIVDNIADCVESSKKILMVFSKDFVNSQWCQFELNYCLRHAMDNDDDLIIVCADDVVSRVMTTAMMAVLKTTTYIQWEEHDDAIASFWGRLRVALNEAIGQVAQ